MRCNIVGWYGEPNVGDRSFETVFRQELKGHDLSFTKLADPEADVVIFGGGGCPLKAALKSPRREDQPWYALGVDIPTNPEHWAQLAALGFKEIYCRSKRAVRDVRSDLGATHLHFVPDIAFALETGPGEWEGPKKEMGIILTRELPHEHRVAFAQAVGEFKHLFNLNFIAMCEHFYDNDGHECRDVAMKIPGLTEENLSTGWQDPRIFLNLIADMDLVVSMRFHGIIFAAIAGTPFVSLANPGKHSTFCEENLLSECYHNLAEFNKGKLIKQIGALKDWNPKTFHEVAATNRELVRHVFHHVKKNWLIGS